MRKRMFVAVVAALLMVLACGDDSSPSGPPSGDTSWIPLKLNNTWNYIYSDTASSSPDTTTISLTVEQTGLTMSFADDVAMLRFLVAGQAADTLYFKGTDDYLKSWELGDDSLWHSETLLELPLEVGDVWNLSTEDSTYTGECLSLTETVTVPAGTFNNCAKIKYTRDDEVEYIYVVQGVGYVKVLEEGDTEVTELSSYSLN